MAIRKTIGGDRLGSGKKQKVSLHGYHRSTHDLGYIWRSTMAAGTLVPFLSEVALPGDTFDIDLDVDVKTHPTIGPLFGSFKIQLDLFSIPIRLYQAMLHNNQLGVGLNIASVLLPQIRLEQRVRGGGALRLISDIDNSQVNPSSILAYLNIRGVGSGPNPAAIRWRNFNAIPLMAYWDIFKNYYANKQETNAYVIAGSAVIATTATYAATGGTAVTLPLQEQGDTGTALTVMNSNASIGLLFPTDVDERRINITFAQGSGIPGGSATSAQVFQSITKTRTANGFMVAMTSPRPGFINVGPSGYNIVQAGQAVDSIPPILTPFPLANIDTMKRNVLTQPYENPLTITWESLAPYSTALTNPNPGITFNSQFSQVGLAVKTYQSDLFNNWMRTEWLDGPSGINAVTAVSTVGNSFTIDTLNLAKKVYEMLNRIAISGGSFDDWIDAVYTHDRYRRVESPVYEGGLSRELVFQEVVSNAEAETSDVSQPLGTLAGRGIIGQRKKGGRATIKIDEPSYVMGIISLTPRIDYSQGNKWDVNLRTLDDLHKPALDQIGFQDLVTDQMAWWDTTLMTSGQPVFRSAGKQPAWINYMTNVNKTYGNFAIRDNQMFMTLNRRYTQSDPLSAPIGDLTTYIDPVKYNYIFAQTSLDAQNFWVQIAVDMIVRRKMSAKVMPNL